MIRIQQILKRNWEAKQNRPIGCRLPDLQQKHQMRGQFMVVGPKQKEKSEIKLALYYIDFMPKTVREQLVRCNQQDFALTPLRADLYIKQPVTLSFCKWNELPKCRNARRNLKQAPASCLCCPVFNKDRNYSTSSFILPEQKKNYIENQAKFKLEHQCRVKQCTDQKSELLVPRPKIKQPYCNVCRASYEDYLTHIKSEMHKLYMARSPFNFLIKDMEAKYDRINLGRNSHFKNFETTDTMLNMSQTDPEIQMLGKPSKRVKSEFGFAPAFCYPFRINQIPEVTKQKAVDTNPTVPSPISVGSDLMNQGIAQFPSFSNLNKNQIYPIAPTMSSVPYQQMNFGYGVDGNLMMGLPMFICGSFASFHQLPQTYYSIPFHSSLQKIQTVHKIEQIDN